MQITIRLRQDIGFYDFGDIVRSLSVLYRALALQERCLTGAKDLNDITDLSLTGAAPGSIEITGTAEIGGAAERLIQWVQTIVDSRYKELLATQLDILKSQSFSEEAAALTAHEKLRHTRTMNGLCETEAGIRLVGEATEMYSKMVKNGLPEETATSALNAALYSIADLIQVQQTSSAILEIRAVPEEE